MTSANAYLNGVANCAQRVMFAAKLSRVLSKLQNLPAISLPTDYPRPLTNKLVEAVNETDLSEQVCMGLAKMALFEDESVVNDEETSIPRPTAFHLLLSAFAALLHRFTGDNHIIIASSSRIVKDPLLLPISLEPSDPFWAIVRRVQSIESEAEHDAVPFELVLDAFQKTKEANTLDSSQPPFRIRFFDETFAPIENVTRSTSLTSDITVFVSRPPASMASMPPRIHLRIVYNSLLFTSARITHIIEQLSAFLYTVSSNPFQPIGSIPILTPAQRSVLPDPVANLNWCDWKGAITDIFSQNARQFPERPCIIQSLPLCQSTDSPTAQKHLVFTYGLILKASNVVAHHLLMGGIQREEVVMVYAHRSVELVVAILGILKAGATFSVIGRNISFEILNLLINSFTRSCVPAFPSGYLSSRCSTPWVNCSTGSWEYPPFCSRFPH